MNFLCPCGTRSHTLSREKKQLQQIQIHGSVFCLRESEKMGEERGKRDDEEETWKIFDCVVDLSLAGNECCKIHASGDRLQKQQITGQSIRK